MADFTKEEIEAELIARKQAETPFFGNPNITAEAEAVRNRVGGYKDPGEGIVPYLPTIGGVAGGLLTRRKEGAGLGATIGRSLAGSSAGTLAGTGAQELSYERTGTERDPFAQRAGENLVENAIFDVGGNLVFASLGKLYRVGKEALQDVPALQGLFKAGETIADFDAKKLAQEMLQKYGATLDKFQVTEGGAARTARGIAQSSFTARPLLEKSEKAVREAVDKEKNVLLDTITTEAYDAQKVGGSVSDIVAAGDAKLKEITRPFYQSLSKDTGVNVNFTPVKNYIDTVVSEASRTKGKTLSAKESELINDIKVQDNAIDFGAAHDLLSSIKTRIRDAKNAKDPDSREIARLVQVEQQITQAMDSSASKLAPELLQKYKETSTLYRESIGELYSGTVQRLLKKDAEKVGDDIYAKGNVTAFQEVKQAVARAKKLDPTLNVQETIDGVRRGYLESVLKDFDSIGALKKTLDTDKKFARTFETVLTGEQKTRVKALTNAAFYGSKQADNALPLFMVGQQAQAVTLAAGGAAYAFNPDVQNAVKDHPLSSMGLIAGVTLGPRALAKVITNPDAVNALLQLNKPIGSLKPAQVLKVFNELSKAGVTESDLNIPQNAQPSGSPFTREQIEAEIARQRAQQ
jgi:DNA repair protein RadC